MTKSILSSHTFRVGVLVAIIGLAVEVTSALTDSGVEVPGWVLAVLGVVQVWLRAQTRTGVYLRQGTPGKDEGPAPEVKP